MTDEHQTKLQEIEDVIKEAKKFIREHQSIVKQYYDKVNLCKSLNVNPYD